MKMDKVAPEAEVLPPLMMEEDFSSLNLSDISPKKKVRTPRKILHFSDGILEEYSTDEEEEETPDATSKVDPKNLSWTPWATYWAKHTGDSLLSACDYVGEGLANFLGITSPKYFYEIEDYKRALQEEEELKKEEESQLAGWTTSGVVNPVTLQENEGGFTEKEMKNELQPDPPTVNSKIPIGLTSHHDDDIGKT